MKKKLFLLLVLLTSSVQTQAQTSKLDSLLKVSKQQKNLILVGTLNEISWEFKNSNIDSAFFYAKKAIMISKKNNDQKSIAISYNSLANCFEALGTLDSALVYHKKSLDIKLQFKNLEGAADSYNNLGIVYDLKGDFNVSLENYFKALKIYENLEVAFNKIPMVLGNIGIVYKKQKEYSKVLIYYQKALKIYEDNNSDFGVAVMKGNIGSVSLNLKEFEKAITYSIQAKELYSALGYKRYVPYMITNIAIAKDSLKLYNEAQQLYKEAIAYHIEEQNLYELSYSKLGLGESYFKEKKYKESLTEIKNALQISVENGFKEFEIRAYKQISKIEANLGNFKEAYLYNEKHIIGKDSLFEESKTKAIFELEAKYESEKKQKEIFTQRTELAENELNIRRKNSQLKSLIVLAIIISLLGYLLYNQQKLKHKQLQKENELKDALVKIETHNKLQEQRLRISRDLHDNIGAQLTFIISAIDNLHYGFKITNDKLSNKLASISEFTKETIYELRDTIWAMNKNEISFEDLQIRISNFIDKADITSKDIKFEFVIDKDVNTKMTFTSIIGMNMYRIIQEAVNNAIKYAEATIISVNIHNKKGAIEFKVKDDGKGFDLANVELGNGINNMKKRAEEIGANLTLDSSNKSGTCIQLQI